MLWYGNYFSLPLHVNTLRGMVLLVVALLPQQQITHTNLCMLGWREQPCTDCMSFWCANKSPSPTTSQTQTLQPSGTAETRKRCIGDREDDENRKRKKEKFRNKPNLHFSIPQSLLLGSSSSPHF